MKNGLLIIHPAITTTPEKVEIQKNLAESQNVNIDNQYLITKIQDESVSLINDNYDVVYYLTPEKLEDMKFSERLISTIGKSMKIGGQFFGLSDKFKLNALLNGFIVIPEEQSEGLGYHWVKKEDKNSSQAAAVSLAPVSLKKKSITKATNGKLPTFVRKNANPLPSFKPAVASQAEQHDQDIDDDEGVDKNKQALLASLLNNSEQESFSEKDLIDARVSSAREDKITAVECIHTGVKRKKACKDCSCGLKEEEEAEIDGVRAAQDRVVVQFTPAELTEIDFTIEGKKVGGCGSCTLGDAFRCDGCPYLGLPAFTPGQAINLTAISDDL
ncbi:hypothetical protein TBLA_0A09410 [Henningerozyma blattae CBS 6284]|uniref:Uncharacterized protein n=1 Tax=Henningerozyma blattae (strain ATCC 34711 / CBS 6284 / DSM 70876 / NBRC 10599 / NRRL Y-10934 / UCD 77-7) TaxID=1071380 RepID=I2GX74_HENB6|nr:hypothetical protein TBLA_0A09410 [Tetrapisispora blattae CBS 6284]CCH58726.1 hypothetical protein TBLA_0A09410 [Tetrapisispora blattae CBS 6284]